ncbi:hypothetical protein ACFE04_028020 [Oxalis oulophora]
MEHIKVEGKEALPVKDDAKISSDVDVEQLKVREEKAIPVKDHVKGSDVDVEQLKVREEKAIPVKDHVKGIDVDVEHTKICLMRELVQKQDPSSKDVDDATLRRFLRARDLDVQKGSTMFLKYLKWRRSSVPNGFISESDVQNEIAQKKMFMQGFDKKGRPIALQLGAKHFQNKTPDEFKRFLVYVLDKICSRLPPGEEKFTIIGDLQGWGYANSDIRGYLSALSVLQDCYPERLGKVFIVHAPYIFMTVWKIIYPFIDNKTKTKIEFVPNKCIKSTMLQLIDESQLPEIYGGKLALVPIQDA